MPSSTVENYLKQILVESIQAESSEVAMGKVAECLQVTPGTATTMMKSLEKKGWLKYRPRKGVMLTSAGRKVGMNMLRRHRLLETFLVETLGLDWGEIHDEAEELEHAISEKVLEKLDEFLGRPSHDPHGDPIPTKRGTMPKASNRSLLDCVEGDCVRIESIQDQGRKFLQFARKNKLVPGKRIEIIRHDEIADSIELKVEQKTILNLGSKTAEKIVIRS
ncbi:MAG TPA: metal-dependent transcriptional regulator [Opitutae bacterium]|jgi:DtxR family Mn-dependent transcriptional regulator|nr:DtxR family transcriptional regulator [Opitutae bacterium]HAF58610.1 metal-dependent transcriptional regulator [Opitutae bacterium]|tara:strand:- start:1485 stop:2144 length:660 start_codon:yes stop_codon:yes gene_type:complete